MSENMVHEPSRVTAEGSADEHTRARGVSSFRFDSRFAVGGSLPDFTQEQVKNEPMLFNCDRDAAWKLGGQITRAFVEKLPDCVQVVDTRVHMLMPDWWPCIPGWHHDDIPRTRPDGQPEYRRSTIRPRSADDGSRHIIALVNGDICPTEFAVGCIELPEIPIGLGTVYAHWHDMVEAAVTNGEMSRVRIPSNALIWFDWQAFHQGVRASANGWRWFGRASWNTDRKPTNELRQQVQVYLDRPMGGW